MKKSTIYTIGHGNKTTEELIKELNSFNIKVLIDIRSKPYSKYSPHFNKFEIENNLKINNIQYVYLGEQLGGLPTDLTCYTNGKVDYEKVRIKDFFIEGLQRLISANEKEIKVAIMCSESNPSECHRTKLIGEELRKNEIIVNHITDVGILKDQYTVIYEVTKGLPITNLFGETTTFTSRKKYI
jgi:uncharacterized protein (DUF488 family)